MVAVSAVVCARNEAEKIEGCLRSLRWADEVIVFDMQSTDDTTERVLRWADRVVSISPAPAVEMVREQMLREASYDWVLVLDPDERVSLPLAQMLRRLLESGEEFAAVNIPVRTFLLGQPMRAFGWYPDYHPRLLHRRKVRWPAALHSAPEIEGRVIDIPPGIGADILHYNYSSVEEFLRKANRYTSLQAQALRRKGRPFRCYKLFYHPLKEFWLRFIVRRGYRDGLHGLVFSLLMACYYLVAYAKLWELERAEGRGDAPSSSLAREMQR